MDAHREVDLLVAGAGPAGMAAALVASLEGLDVLLCEKSDQVGGTGATSAGTLWIPGNRQSKAAGFTDSVDEADRYLDALIGAGTNRALRDAYLHSGPDVIDYLEACTDVQFMPCGTHPDYRSNMPGAAVSGRAIIPRPFDGRLLGKDFLRIRPPIPEFMVFGGMMVGKTDIPPLIGRFRSLTNFIYSAKLVVRYLMDRLRYPRGTRIMMGNALVGRLYYSLRKRNVPVLFNASITDVTGGGPKGITGARLQTADGEMLVRARKGIVLATGGYAHNKRLREAFMPQPVPSHSMSCAGNRGDGIEIGRRHGAATAPEHCTSGLWTPVSITTRGDGSKGMFPHLVLDRAKPGLIAVNAAGRRFVNEAVSYHDFVLAMFESHKTTPSIPAWLICGEGFIAKYGLGAIYPGTRNLAPFEASGYLVSARTTEELAAKLGIDADGLRSTVERYNGFAAAGVDIDFGKGETELNRFNGDAAHKPSPCIGALAPPFHAMALWPADIAVSTGLATDTDARVLDGEGKPIPGLYACGNDMASVMGGSYPGPGTTLGPGIVFAFRAVMHARGQG
jgi:succinate dehydrogenase/fumarate reductase flavoprotein subunit